ncbi:MFS transporter [Paenibacillus glucanolyticus]|jgi:EmrB/QacA subfamily drug resistance transporter|uniref:MDR family MFS transporter n=1 Tax=Paenibacillus TaxID=44249 RepID=UPI0003E2678E|nr:MULTISPECIES: MDR family MFS transporter [Paenibacillus]ANA80674.1 MFS transporter [Paenibacillus glucanolyticus]AVV55255.1 MFS transporter [Paenibacillus glucanolyticus]AWP29841.1 MFS transporter [Paenibacillus sp. Cedars]ETT30866.1 EmrB/QacA subfamily drug resistance transporter [Paenibacillus sp. FSL R5-808]MPY15557.1 MFS transporter [Paenibacillus glucanolyticus]
MNAQQSNIKLVVAGLLLGIFMAAIDNTIVATALSTIIRDLQGFDQVVWVTSIYMVAVMAGTPIFGKLSDMYGRKRFFIFGLVVFLIGSALCGMANNMTELIIYRAIQGIGGGALMPIAFTIVFDLFPPEKRGKMTGLLGAVFGTSSIMGPLLGAFITDSVGWEWIFYVNVPIGIVSFIFIMTSYKETRSHAKQKIDWTGAATLVGAIICLMFGLELGGQTFAWDSPQILGLFGGFIALFVVFLFAETRAAEPIISFQMFRKRLFASSNIVALFYGATFIVATIYIPIFVSGVYGGTATNSGLILMPMMLGSVAGSQGGGMLTTRTSFRNIMILSVFCFIAGIFCLSTINPDTPRYLLTIFMVLTGFGVGFSFSTLSMASIHNFDARQRGAATSTNSFLRSFGMTVGITIFGIIQRNGLNSRLAEAAGNAPAGVPLNADVVLSPEVMGQLPPNVREQVTVSLADSIANTFMWALVPAVLALVFVLMMGNERVAVPSKAKGA